MQIRILIVDDEVEIITALEKTFTTLLKNYLVLSATSANAGLSMIKELKPDIIILDLKLGAKSGMDLLRDYHEYIRDSGSQYHPRFIVMTGYPSVEVMREAHEKYKVDAFLKKPFDDTAIVNEVIKSVKKMMALELRYLSFYEHRCEQNKKAEALV